MGRKHVPKPSWQQRTWGRKRLTTQTVYLFSSNTSKLFFWTSRLVKVVHSFRTTRNWLQLFGYCTKDMYIVWTRISVNVSITIFFNYKMWINKVKHVNNIQKIDTFFWTWDVRRCRWDKYGKNPYKILNI